jgi:hypothetical protein
MRWVSSGFLVRWVSVAGWWDNEGEEALLSYWIVRNFCWWGSESCLLIGQNLMSESYVMIGQSWAMHPYWSELDDWIILEFSCLNRELWLVGTWWDNSSWDFWLNRVSLLAGILFMNPTCWLVRTWWLICTWWLVRVDYVRLWTKIMD